MQRDESLFSLPGSRSPLLFQIKIVWILTGRNKKNIILSKHPNAFVYVLHGVRHCIYSTAYCLLFQIFFFFLFLLFYLWLFLVNKTNTHAHFVSAARDDFFSLISWFLKAFTSCCWCVDTDTLQFCNMVQTTKGTQKNEGERDVLITRYS